MTARVGAAHASKRSAPARWYRQPVLWLGALLFAASIAGCIQLIIAASRYPDDALPAHEDRLLKMPLHEHGGA